MYSLNLILINVFLSLYLLFALQNYNYSFYRILFHYHLPSWHLYFFFFPLAVYELDKYYAQPQYFLLFCIFIYLPCVYFWNKKLSKRLVFTPRIKAYFYILSLILLFFIAFVLLKHLPFIGIEPLILALICSSIFEHFKMNYFYKQARKKLLSMSELKVVLITASFGKTSMKNFLFELLNESFRVYKTPRSVNTLAGITQDINDNLPPSTKIYIVEAGARQKGDIAKITKLVQPQFIIVGEIGKAHLEYFKSVENIRQTKLEALLSPRLKRAFLHSSTLCEGHDFYDTGLENVRSSLNGLDFDLFLGDKKEHFHAPLLGSFNAQNLCACLKLAYFLGVDIKTLQSIISKISPIKHRLELLCREPKLIIDDGFNGNLSGMSDSYAICKEYPNRRVVVTPGILEVDEEENIALAKEINKSFDFAILTSKANAQLIASNLSIEYFILKDKAKLDSTLAKLTHPKDLILFSNDAPSFL